MNDFFVLPIKKIISETPTIKTFCFSHNLRSKAGQFVMLWVPGVGQKPFSVGYDNGKEFHLTIFKRGKVTAAIFALKVGDRVGIAGPYGTCFTAKPGMHYIMIAGGYGAAPLRFLVERVSALRATSIDFCLGAKNCESLLFEKRLKKIEALRLHIATDNGSKGHQGYVTDFLPSLLKSGGRKIVAACGPELMEKTVLEFCNRYKTPCEISIERYIKCGVGVCGQCAVDDEGICLCKEGPVVKRQIANRIIEFGHYSRGSNGLAHFCKSVG